MNPSPFYFGLQAQSGTGLAEQCDMRSLLFTVILISSQSLVAENVKIQAMCEKLLAISTVPGIVVEIESPEGRVRSQVEGILKTADEMLFAKVASQAPLHVEFGDDMTFRTGIRRLTITKDLEDDKSLKHRSQVFLVHEFTHSVNDIYFRAEIPQYDKMVQVMVRNDFRPPALDFDKAEFDHGVMMLDLVRPYDEILADLGAALYFDAPDVVAKAAKQFPRTLMHRLLRQFNAAKRDDYRDFSHLVSVDEIDSMRGLDVYSAFLPTRNLIWHLYESSKSKMSKAQFFDSIRSAVVSEIQRRIESYDFSSFPPFGHPESKLAQASALNKSLIERILLDPKLKNLK